MGRITLTVDPIHPKKYLFVVTPVERFFTLNVILNEYETDLFLSLQKNSTPALNLPQNPRFSSGSKVAAFIPQQNSALIIGMQKS